MYQSITTRKTPVPSRGIGCCVYGRCTGLVGWGAGLSGISLYAFEDIKDLEVPVYNYIPTLTPPIVNLSHHSLCESLRTGCTACTRWANLTSESDSDTQHCLFLHLSTTLWYAHFSWISSWTLWLASYILSTHLRFLVILGWFLAWCCWLLFSLMVLWGPTLMTNLNGFPAENS